MMTNADFRGESDRIVGYTIFNDWSARDIQRTEGRLPFGFFKGN